MSNPKESVQVVEALKMNNIAVNYFNWGHGPGSSKEMRILFQTMENRMLGKL